MQGIKGGRKCTVLEGFPELDIVKCGIGGGEKLSFKVLSAQPEFGCPFNACLRNFLGKASVAGDPIAGIA
jgi:hypothetical protein